jgi:hypothetical protein
MVTTVEQLLAGLGSGIESSTGVCGGDPRIANTHVAAHRDEIERQIFENEEAWSRSSTVTYRFLGLRHKP